MSSRMLNFGYLNPAACLYYDVDNNLIVMFRGGVEDTKLGAKDSKKPEAKDSSSEDRPFRGQT